uniref:Peptidase M13 C-terminal domain-containing protein n=2 Tax=Clastoptera arizonana TaxID=38151 RepID=A0A1B6DCV9_9HEMI
MTHAFDDEGRQYDKDGNLFDWWQKETTRLYEDKAKQIIQEYSNFTVQEINMKMKGVNTQGENIADQAGAKIAYTAYIKRASRFKEEERLPNFLNYTSNQMFWISAGHSWCTKYRPETLRYLVKTGNHPPAEYRVNGPFRFSKYFARDFSCPKDSFMNPSEKHNVWR